MQNKDLGPSTCHGCMSENQCAADCNLLGLCCLPPSQALPSLIPHLLFLASSRLEIEQTHTHTHTALRYLAVPLHLLTPPSSALPPTLPLPCFLYLLSDGLSSVRWMCAFPGQMALLLLAVPGSHFNTLASLPGERAPLLQGAANVCVVRRTAWVLALFFVCCQGLDFQHRLCANRDRWSISEVSTFFFFLRKA